MKIQGKPFIILTSYYKKNKISIPKIHFLKDPHQNKLDTHDLHYFTTEDLQHLFVKQSFKLMSNIVKYPSDLGLSKKEADDLLKVFTSIREMMVSTERDIIINPRLRVILFRSNFLPFFRWIIIKNSIIYPIERSRDFSQFKHMLRKICK